MKPNKQAFKKFEKNIEDPSKLKGEAPTCTGDFGNFHDPTKMVKMSPFVWQCPKCGKCTP